MRSAALAIDSTISDRCSLFVGERVVAALVESGPLACEAAREQDGRRRAA